MGSLDELLRMTSVLIQWVWGPKVPQQAFAPRNEHANSVGDLVGDYVNAVAGTSPQRQVLEPQ